MFLAEKTEDDIEREARLVEQWVGLTEERNAVLVPAPGSGIPGAPANWYVVRCRFIALLVKLVISYIIYCADYINSN